MKCSTGIHAKLKYVRRDVPVGVPLDNAICFGFILLLNFSTINIRCWDSRYILISVQFKYGYPLSISCSKFPDICKIKRMVIKEFYE